GSYVQGALVVGVAAAFSGVSVGLAQYWTLRRRIRNAGWWVPASGAALVIAVLAGGAISEAIIESGNEKWYEVANIFFGWGGIKPGTLLIAIYGTITGFALLRLLGRQAQAKDAISVWTPANLRGKVLTNTLLGGVFI